MPLRYQKRVNLGKGVGINISSSGLSTSYRSKFGSVGSKGFSFRTGIPGVSYRSTWGKGGGYLLLFFLVYVVVMAVLMVGYNLIRLLIYLIARLVEWIRRKPVEK